MFFLTPPLERENKVKETNVNAGEREKKLKAITKKKLSVEESSRSKHDERTYVELKVEEQEMELVNTKNKGAK